MKRVLVLVLTLWAIGCGTSGSSGEITTFCEVRLVFERKCQRCHTDEGDVDTPFNLETYEEVMDQIPAIERVVERGTMPLQLDLEPEVEPLREAEEQAILEWIDAGTPRGDCE